MTASTYKPPSIQLVVPAHIPLHTWVMLYDARDVPHAVPTGDMYPHYALNCACQPLLLDDIQQHNSFDQREYFENRLRKPS